MSRTPVLGDGLPPLLRELLGDGIEVVEWEGASAADLGRVRALITYGHPRVDNALLERTPNVCVVSNHGVGVDHIHLPDCRARGIPVGNTPGILDGATADMTLALLLSLARNVVVGDRFARGPEFTHYDPSILIGKEVSGATLGIVGMGRIGKQVARRAKAFDMRVLYHNRKRDVAAEESLGVEYRGFDALLGESDFVALNCPLTPETTGLVSHRELGLMKRSAMLINVARGPVVDGQALCEALHAGTIAGAALDVTDPEPLPRDHPLLTAPHLVITPHLGSAADRTRRRMMEMTVENLQAGLARRPLPYAVP